MSARLPLPPSPREAAAALAAVLRRGSTATRPVTSGEPLPARVHSRAWKCSRKGGHASLCWCVCQHVRVSDKATIKDATPSPVTTQK